MMVYEDPYDRQQARIQALQACVETLQKALLEYGGHTAICGDWTPIEGKGKCECGWAEVARELLKMVKTTHNKNA